MEQFLYIYRDRGHNSYGYSKSCLGCFNGSLYFFPFTRSMGKKWTLEVIRIELIEESNHINCFIDRSATCFELFKKYLHLGLTLHFMNKILSIKEIFPGFPYLYLESKGIHIIGILFQPIPTKFVLNFLFQ